MSWAKLDDRFWANRKIRAAWRACRASVGLHVMAITYCAAHDTDGMVDPDWIETQVPKLAERKRVLAALAASGLFEHIPAGEARVVQDRDGNVIELQPYAGEEAWLIHDYLVYNDSSIQRSTTRTWDRKRKELERDRDLVAAIRERDGDRCRYCGKAVNWRDRRSGAGGTYDHIEPRGENSLQNVVVACRGCNLRKGPRTPDEAQMPLLAVGQVGSSPRLERGQNGPGPRSALPDPTRPDPTFPPGPPPSGGRKRAIEDWRETAVAWCRLAGVDGTDERLLRAVEQAKPWNDNGDAASQFRVFAAQHFRSLSVKESA